MRSCTARSRAIAVKRPSAPPPAAVISAAKAAATWPEIVARDVGDDEDAGLRRVVERRGDARGARAVRQVAQPGRRFRRLPGEVGLALAVGQGRRGHDDAVRRLRHRWRERDAGIDPVAVDRDIGLGAVDPVERQPLDRFGARRLAEIAQQRAPAAELHVGAPFEAADRRVEPLPQPRLGRVLRIFELAAQAGGEAAQRLGQPVEPAASRPAGLGQAVDRRPGFGLDAVAGVARRGARQHLPAHQRQKALEPGRPRSSATRWCQPSAGRTRAATSASISAGPASSSASTRSPMRRCRPRARDRPASAPSSQRRSSRPSWPDSRTEKAASAASNRWWPSSNT